MRVKITSPGEYDRHDNEVRFIAVVNGQNISVAITTYALFIVGEALAMPTAEPLVTYAASGRLLEAVVKEVVENAGAAQSTYLISHDDVLRVTGISGKGNSHVPKLWRN